MSGWVTALGGAVPGHGVSPGGLWRLTQLAASVPHLLGVVVGGVHLQPQRVDAAELLGVVPDQGRAWAGGGEQLSGATAPTGASAGPCQQVGVSCLHPCVWGVDGARLGGPRS